MSAEHKGNGLSRRSFLTILATGGLAIAAKPLSDLDNTLRVYAALSGGTVDCATDRESDSTYPYGVIAVPGGGIELTAEGEYRPNIFERLRLEGAAIAYLEHAAPKVILLDGAMDPRVDPLINKTYLQEEVKRLSGGQSELPDDAVTIEHTTINTATNMEALARLVAASQENRVLIVTNRFHRLRTALLACANGMPAITVAAEERIIKKYPGRAAALNDLYWSPEVQAMTRKEEAEILWQLFDPRAKVPTLLKQLQILLES